MHRLVVRQRAAVLRRAVSSLHPRMLSFSPEFLSSSSHRDSSSASEAAAAVDAPAPPPQQRRAGRHGPLFGSRPDGDAQQQRKQQQQQQQQQQRSVGPGTGAAAAAGAGEPSSSSPTSSMSSEEQEELYRRGGMELGRAWEREGGVKPGVARFERVLHGHDLDEMERCWRELKKEDVDFHRFQRFILVMLDDRHLPAWETGAGGRDGPIRRRVRLAWKIYQHAHGRRMLDPDSGVLAHQRGRIYLALARGLSLIGDGWRAQELAEHMEAAGYLPPEEAMSNLVVALCKCRMRREAHQQFEMARRRGVILSIAAKSCLVACHARALDAPAAAHVLDAALQEATLNDNPGEVSGNMVRKVLEVGIECADVDALRRGLAALSVPIDRGMGLQILNVAARQGDGQLAMDMFYAMEGWGYAPTAPAYNAVLQALALSRNDVAMLKALNEMCAFGLEPSPGTLHLLARELSSSVARLDEAYNNLVAMQRAYMAHVQQHQQQQQQGEGGGKEASGAASYGGGGAAAAAAGGPAPLPVAAAAVYLIVLGCAYDNQLDRGFATFEDYGPVFGLRHDAPACNALLMACLRSRNLQVGAAFSVMTEMERLGVTPDQEALHLMVRILMHAKEPDVGKMDQVLAFMESHGVQPRADTLRLLALWHALTGDHERAGDTLSAMQAQGFFVPSYLPKRLEQIKANGDRIR